MRIPRLLLSAAASGSGKTLITCGLMNLFQRRGLRVASFKCGPDYIDPMFHRTVIGTKSQNLDAFFTGEDTLRALFAKSSTDCDLAVIEGVMGYYDGVGGVTTRASAYDVARITRTPAVLLVDARGASVSLAAQIQGFAAFQRESHIGGVILNRLSPMMYSRMKKLIEEKTGIPVLGYVPVLKDCTLESRHLGLLLPEEVADLKGKLDTLSDVLEDTLDVEGLLKLAGDAPKFSVEANSAWNWMNERKTENTEICRKLRIGIARDAAFCFIYKENMELLERLGAELIPFSPMTDPKLPPDLDGLLLYGGYPELHARELSENVSMREQIKKCMEEGLPVIAECGGFLYLNEVLTDMEGISWPMVGALPGASENKGKLGRFGYITLEGVTAFGRFAGDVPAHEFHYYDAANCGEAYTARKPESTRSWKCMHSTETLLAGFPHLYYYGNRKVAENFLMACQAYHISQGGL
ncbi:MAG: cobyrinate a,c-diamide synthase [Lachnospiraceae bacterium]|nr:cobyrinate a,c-diamide synthase [Lachnospiraceae bacterium]